ncbi:TolC family protein [uncultured Proteiniphilum sp.]|uniref:TolC family protein n=1 Tax=uncultured Proteiniphilum sp. TaxID=497637 RepID=UPI002629CA8C|nr:TolC family protein [uncultured Proteiniphilum sp.]
MFTLKIFFITLLFVPVTVATTFAQTDASTATFTPQQASDSLAHYLETAARNNPAVRTDFLTYKASLEKMPQAGAFPDPQLDIGFFLQPMEIIDGRQIADFTVMQMFSWFGTRKAARTEAEHMANMAFEQFRETRDNLYLQVYTQWFLLCSLQQQLINSRENKGYLAQLETLALRRFSASPAGNPASGGRTSISPVTGSTPIGPGSRGTTGNMGSMGSMGSTMGGAATQSSTTGGSMSSMSSGTSMQNMSTSTGMADVLRVQLEIAELENNIESILSQIDAETAAFNALLNRQSDSKVHLPDSIIPIPFSLDVAVTAEQINQHNPMLAMIDEEGSAYKAKAEMDKKMSYPMVGIGLQYSVIAKRMDMGHTGLPATDMNGMDMIMPMVSISLPIYRSKYKAQQKESNIRWQASRQQYADTQNALQTELYRTRHSLDDASRKIALYEKQSQLARTTYHLLVQEFISGKSDLSDVIQVQRQSLDYRLKKAQAVAEYNTMVASIQKLISFQENKE